MHGRRALVAVVLASLVLAVPSSGLTAPAEVDERTTVLVPDDAGDTPSPFHDITTVSVHEDARSKFLHVRIGLGMADPMPPRWSVSLHVESLGKVISYRPGDAIKEEANCEASACSIEDGAAILELRLAHLGNPAPGETIDGIRVHTYEGAVTDVAPGPGGALALHDALDGQLETVSYTVLGPAEEPAGGSGQALEPAAEAQQTPGPAAWLVLAVLALVGRAGHRSPR